METSQLQAGCNFHPFPAPPVLPFASTRIRRQLAILAADGRAQDQLPLDSVWQRLIDGDWSVCDHFTTEQRLHFIVKRKSRPGPPPQVDLLRRALLGERQKALAIDIERSPSQIAIRVGRSLSSMGFRREAARVPLLLVASVGAAAGLIGPGSAQVAYLDAPFDGEMVISLSRFDHDLQARLTPAEGLVIRLLIEGRSHQEIATERGCAKTTVANQVSSAFRKLDVSCRAELLLYAVKHSRLGRERGVRAVQCDV